MAIQIAFVCALLVCVALMILAAVLARSVKSKKKLLVEAEGNRETLAAASSKELDAAKAEVTRLTERLGSVEADRDRRQDSETEWQQRCEVVRNELALAKENVARLEAKTERVNALEGELSDLKALREQSEAKAAQLDVEVARVQTALNEQQRANEEKLAEFHQRQEAVQEAVQEAMKDQFRAVSGEVVAKSQNDIMNIAEKLLEQQRVRAAEDQEQRREALVSETKPLQDSVKALGAQVETLEKNRAEQFGQLRESISTLANGQGQLVNAFKRPATRGRHGEIQLQNLVEAAGMSELCDFQTQATTQTEDGALRPDMIVKLPNGRCVIVDAKMPLDAYLRATEAGEDEQAKHLADHAKQVRAHVTQLASKNYANAVDGAPEFVTMFIPYDAVYQAAIENDRGLFDYAIERKILVATPMTLLALIHAVNMGWREQRLAENAAAIRDLGIELHGRLAGFATNLSHVGKGLGRAVKAYNDAVGSFDARVMVTARKFEQLDAVSPKELVDADSVDIAPRELRAAVDVAANTDAPESEAA